MAPSLMISWKLDCQSRKHKPKKKPITIVDSRHRDWVVLLLLLPTRHCRLDFRRFLYISGIAGKWTLETGSVQIKTICTILFILCYLRHKLASFDMLFLCLFWISLFLVTKVKARNKKAWNQLIQIQVSVAFIEIKNDLLLFQGSLSHLCIEPEPLPEKRASCATCNRILGTEQSNLRGGGEGYKFRTQKNLAW